MAEADPEPCPYLGCNRFDISTLSPCRRKDHIEVHKLMDRRDETSGQRAGLEKITQYAMVSFNVRDFPPSLERTPQNLYRYYRIIGFPAFPDYLKEDLDPLAGLVNEVLGEDGNGGDNGGFGDKGGKGKEVGLKGTKTRTGKEQAGTTGIQALNTEGVPTLDISSSVYRHGIKLPTLAQLGPQIPPRRVFCDKPGCNMVETTPFSEQKLLGHNWIHEHAARFHDDDPKHQWLYELEAGYYFDGVVALWESLAHYAKSEGESKNKQPLKEQVRDYLWKYGWEPAPEYECLYPASEGAEFLYGPCWRHPENTKILCTGDGCRTQNAVWAIVGSLIGRINIPGLGRVTSERPEPVVRVREVRFRGTKKKAAEGLLMNIKKRKEAENQKGKGREG